MALWCFFTPSFLSSQTPAGRGGWPLIGFLSLLAKSHLKQKEPHKRSILCSAFAMGESRRCCSHRCVSKQSPAKLQLPPGRSLVLFKDQKRGRALQNKRLHRKFRARDSVECLDMETHLQIQSVRPCRKSYKEIHLQTGLNQAL